MPNIHDTTTSTLRRIGEESQAGLRELALFAGAGGGILGGHLLGWRTVCAVEWEPYPCAVLCARQNEGVLPPFPIWDDVRTFDGRAWRGRVDVVSGGFPCQDISAAGKGAGIDGERSGMWAHMARIVREVGPRYVFVENSPMLTSRGLGRVLGDLAAMGYDARWGVLGAVDAGAPHKRDRIWIVANATNDRAGWRKQLKEGSERTRNVANSERPRLQGGTRRGLHDARGASIESTCRNQDMADAHLPFGEGVRRPERSKPERANTHASSAWWGHDPAEHAESRMGRMADGVAARVDRLKAIGNGQVPAVAALAWRILSQ